MAHNIFHTGFEFIEDKTSDLVDSAKKFGTDLYVDYKVNQMVDSFKDEFKGPTTITPEMAAEGWKPGLDNIPYNSKLNEKFEPGGIFYDPDVDKNTAIANAVASGKISSAEAGTEAGSPFLRQDLRQRTPSGTVYNPSMDAYNESSLFNYEGPGGVSEYTYGQGLRTGGEGYGTPPGPNLYYEGQYGDGFVKPTVEPPKITLPPVLPPITMPEGVPQVPSINTSPVTTPSTPSGTSDGGGNAPINTGTFPTFGGGNGPAPSTTITDNTGSGLIGNAPIGTPSLFPNFTGPSGMTLPADESGIAGTQQFMPSGMTLPADESGIGNTQQFMPSGMTLPANESGIGNTQQFMPSGMTMPANESGIGNTQQFMPSGMTLPANESGIAGTQQFMPSGMTMPADESGIFGTQQFMPSGMTMPADESGIAGTQQQLPTNTVTNPFEDSMSIPSVASPSESGTVNSMSYLSDNFPAGYNAPPASIFEDAIMLNMSDMSTPTNENNDMSGYTFGGSTDNPGFDELIMSGVNLVKKPVGAGVDFIANLFDGDKPSAEEVAESVTKEPSIWSSVMETIAGTAGMGFPGGNNSGMTMPTSFINEPTGNIEGQDMYNAFVQNASDLAAEFPTADPSITYSESPLFNTEIQNALLNNQPTIYNTPPVGPPSVISAPPPVYVPPPTIFRPPPAPAPAPAPVAGPPNRPVYNTPPSAPPSYSPPARPSAPSRPTYSFTPSYGGPGGYRF